MEESVRLRLAAQHGVASVRQLAEVGCSRHAVDRLVRQRELVRLRRDAVVDAKVWSAATPWERHAVRGRGVMQSLDPSGDGPIALSHHSALAIHGLATYGGDDRVHLVRSDAQRGRSDDSIQVHAPVPAASVMTVDDVRVTHPALAALQVAGTFGPCAGLVAADSALHLMACSPADLVEVVEGHNFGKGIGAVRWVVALADGRIESAGESRTRWVLRVMGLPPPTPQVVIVDDDGEVVGRVDFLYRKQRTIVEFDGMLKYATPEDVRAEKIREDRLRALGYEVVRLTWADLQHPDRVRAKIRAAFARQVGRAA